MPSSTVTVTSASGAVLSTGASVVFTFHLVRSFAAFFGEHDIDGAAHEIDSVGFFQSGECIPIKRGR